MNVPFAAVHELACGTEQRSFVVRFMPAIGGAADSRECGRMSAIGRECRGAQSSHGRIRAATAAEYFGRVSKQQTLDAVAETAGPSAEGSLLAPKKDALAKEAEKKPAGTGRLPKDYSAANAVGADGAHINTPSSQSSQMSDQQGISEFPAANISQRSCA